MARWKIEREWTASPTPGSDRDAAYAFELSAEGVEPAQVTVEYAAPSRLASSSHARSVVSQHLDDETPPRRIIVGREGDARAAE